MTERRRRRIVRRAVMVVAVVVLLPVAYASSYLSVMWLVGRWRIQATSPLMAVYAPLEAYQFSDLPGGAEFLAVAIYCQRGGSKSLKWCRETADGFHAFEWN